MRGVLAGVLGLIFMSAPALAESRLVTGDDEVIQSGAGKVTINVDWIREGGQERLCSFQGAEVDCDVGGNSWSPSRQCYVSWRVPQPAKSDPVWGGKRNGQIFDCLSPRVPLRHLPSFWAPVAPSTGPPPIEVAKSATESMQLEPFDIGITPPSGTEGLVSLPTWLWAESPSQHQWASQGKPRTLTASAGPVWVTAKAYVSRIVWDMGDGSTVSCDGPGERYRKSFGAARSASCGYVYYASSGDMPDRSYQVTARSYWVVDWSETGISNGQSGQFRFDLESNAQVRVGELQLLVRR